MDRPFSALAQLLAVLGGTLAAVQANTNEPAPLALSQMGAPGRLQASPLRPLQATTFAAASNSGDFSLVEYVFSLPEKAANAAPAPLAQEATDVQLIDPFDALEPRVLLPAPTSEPSPAILDLTLASGFVDPFADILRGPAATALVPATPAPVVPVDDFDWLFEAPLVKHEVSPIELPGIESGPELVDWERIVFEQYQQAAAAVKSSRLPPRQRYQAHSLPEFSRWGDAQQVAFEAGRALGRLSGGVSGMRRNFRASPQWQAWAHQAWLATAAPVAVPHEETALVPSASDYPLSRAVPQAALGLTARALDSAGTALLRLATQLDSLAGRDLRSAQSAAAAGTR